MLNPEWVEIRIFYIFLAKIIFLIFHVCFHFELISGLIQFVAVGFVRHKPNIIHPITSYQNLVIPKTFAHTKILLGFKPNASHHCQKLLIPMCQNLMIQRTEQALVLFELYISNQTTHFQVCLHPPPQKKKKKKKIITTFSSTQTHVFLWHITQASNQTRPNLPPPAGRKTILCVE